MRTRRAALIVALVLGLSALAASLNPPPPRPAAPPPRAPAQADDEASAPVRARIDASGERRRRVAVERGRRAVITVEVPEAGQVAIEGLGLISAADERAPALFDLFAGEPGRHPIVFRPLEGPERRIGTVVVAPPA